MLLLRGATIHPTMPDGRLPVSIHAPLARSNAPLWTPHARRRRFNTCSSCEEQRFRRDGDTVELLFQYMLLLRGATPQIHPESDPEQFQYMLLLRGATCKSCPVVCMARCFNTCSSCEEQRACDSSRPPRFCFNTCSSCEEQRACPVVRCISERFQYMLLLRGATRCRVDNLQGGRVSFNTCSSCEEQLVVLLEVNRMCKVSIHAPLARSNCQIGNMEVSTFQFQYMLLLRGATGIQPELLQILTVSIHAPLARSNFFSFSYSPISSAFQYMLLLRGATTCGKSCSGDDRFQYMLLLRGATCSSRAAGIVCVSFNTCSSCEEQQKSHCFPSVETSFNTCSSCEEQL